MDYLELYPEIRVETPGVPDFQIEDALARAAHDYFWASRAWRSVTDNLVHNPDRPLYRVNLPSDTLLVEPTRVWIDGRALSTGLFWPGDDERVEVSDYIKGRDLKIEVAVAPTRDAEELPDRVGREARQALVFGTLARLLRVPKTRWTDVNRAMLYHNEFELLSERAATRAENNGQTNRTRTVRYGGL